MTNERLFVDQFAAPEFTAIYTVMTSSFHANCIGILVTESPCFGASIVNTLALSPESSTEHVALQRFPVIQEVWKLVRKYLTSHPRVFLTDALAIVCVQTLFSWGIVTIRFSIVEVL